MPTTGNRFSRSLSALLALVLSASAALAQSGTIINPKKSNGTIHVEQYASAGLGTAASPWTFVAGNLSAAVAACQATQIIGPSIYGGCTLKLAPGHYKVTAKTTMGGGIRIEGDGANSTVIDADAAFSGSAILEWKNPLSDNTFGGTIVPGAGGSNFTVQCNGVAAHGIDVFKGYDNVTFDTVAVQDVGDTKSGFIFEPNVSGSTNYVSQTVTLINTYTIHKNGGSGVTGPLYSFEGVQEMSLLNTKGIGGYSANAAVSADVFLFKDCRGVSATGLVASATSTNGIHIQSTGTHNSQSIGLFFHGTTIEAATTSATIEGSGGSYVQDVEFRGVRSQSGTINGNNIIPGPFVFKDVIRAFADIPGFTATVDSACSDVRLHLLDFANLTSDSGTRTHVDTDYDTGHGFLERTIGEGLNLNSGANGGPELIYAHRARLTDWWRSFWSANGGADFGYQLRYYSASGATNKRAAVYDSGGAAHFFYNDNEKLATTNTGITVTGTAVADVSGSVTAGSGKSIIATGGTLRPPNGTLASRPATCTVGDVYFCTDCTLGQQWQACSSTNVWTLQGDGGGSVAFSALGGGTNSTATMTVGTGATLTTSGSGTIIATSVSTNPITNNTTGTSANVSGTVAETHGGTNQTSYVKGDLLFASAANTLGKLAFVSTATRYLANTGSAGTVPAWDQVNLTNGVTGSLPLANGGNGLSGGTSGGIPYFASASTMASSAVLAANGIVYGGGAATAPASSSATVTSGGSISIPTAQTLDIAAHATNGGSVVFKEGADDGTNTVTLKVPDAGLAADKVITFVPATGNLPASAIEDSGTVSKCAHFNASGILVAASGDCATGGGGTGTVTGVGPGCTTGTCFTNGTASSGTTMLDWEGTTVDAFDTVITAPADPTALYTLTFPDGAATITLPVGTDTLVGKATTDTLTNKTLNVESTGNVVTTVEKVWLPAAGCNGATAGSFWDLPASTAPTPTCVTGTNTQKAYLDFPDSDGAYYAQTSIALPSDWTGTVDAKIKWLSSITTGDVFWQLSTICVADAETDDPAFNTASTVADTAKGTTNQTNDATITGVTVTGCAAGELMHIKLMRDRTNGSDTLGAASARLIGVELTLRRAQ